MPASAIFCLCLTAGLVAFGMRFLRARIALFNLAAAALALGLYEGYLKIHPSGELHRETSSGFWTSDPELGYAIVPGPRTGTEKLTGADGSVIYNVKYTIDQFGLRTVFSGDSRAADDKPILFVGDSFTFGVGVNDEETLPQQYSKISGRRVINFGVSGYGAHQVLRELETDRPRAVNPHDPLAIVYLVLPTAHMFRASGRADWDQNGPQYEIVDGSLKYIGHFSDHAALWQRILGLSGIYKKWLAPKIAMTNTDTDRKRLLSVVTRIRDLSISRYHAPFFVLVWEDSESSDSAWLRERLRDADVPTLALLDDEELRSFKHQFPLDGHPTREGYTIAATAVNIFLEKNLRLMVQR
jgi:hypothetical protein